MLTEAFTASRRSLLSAYRSVLFPALIGAEFALACGQLQDFSSLTLHPRITALSACINWRRR